MSQLHANYRNIVVIGASAGGVEAILEVIKNIPEDARVAVFVVQHIPAYSKSNLHKVLANHTSFHTKKAEDQEPIMPGTIYVARADRHLMVEDGMVIVSKGPRENRFRPAVDTLFRSAANAYQERVIGVVLSGALNDGTSGMWSIKRYGGTAIVQDPEEAMFPDMPQGVMRYTDVDYVLSAADIGKKIGEVSRRQIVESQREIGISEEKLLEIELEIAKGKNGLNMGILEQGKPSALACPECHGALTQFEEGKLLRYRCHTGHAHTAESLLASIKDNVEKSMWEVMRGLEESNLLLNKMAQKMEAHGQSSTAENLKEQAKSLQRKAKEVQRVIELSDLSADEYLGAENKEQAESSHLINNDI
ncbi:chemotaxis protein CheB [Lewinella sp. IMCC34191]|uniref:chemotaxis protein CheB n=1 Tax=Lewinella sp. IMCC34191 TaxID=2259172 RepID=UPI000E285B11|nr:chemotaxis protein CheB [Lewinella sp. IMCC34191]